jgi:hypothetical protein
MGEVINFLEYAMKRNIKLPILEESFDEQKIRLTPEEMKVIRAEIERYKALKNADRFANCLATNKRPEVPYSSSEMDALEDKFEFTEE